MNLEGALVHAGCSSWLILNRISTPKSEQIKKFVAFFFFSFLHRAKRTHKSRGTEEATLKTEEHHQAVWRLLRGQKIVKCKKFWRDFAGTDLFSQNGLMINENLLCGTFSTDLSEVIIIRSAEFRAFACLLCVIARVLQHESRSSH